MKNLDNIADELFNKVRGRFPNVTIGDAEGKVTNVPEEARFFDFEYKESDRALGKVSISIDEDSLSVMYSNDFVANEDAMTRDNWYNFLKELRVFSKKRMLNFDTRNITKSNLDRRDYNFLATNRTEEEQMTESTMYGTDKTSFQKFGNAKLSIKHSTPISVEENSRARSQKIGKIYIENAEGEKFKYPYKHLSGARAMATHVSEGGYPYDDFGKHIISMSEELSKLRKFKTYMGRSSVMAESLAGYVDIVKERAVAIKKEISNLQKTGYYKEAVEGFEAPVLEDVPTDVAENWIDQLTIKQFNEELQDVFPYIYNLVSEATKATELGPQDLEEGPIDWIKGKYQKWIDARQKSLEQYRKDLELLRTVLVSHGYDDNTVDRIEQGCLNDPRVCLYNTIRKSGAKTGDMDMEVKRIGQELNSGFTTRVGTTDEQIEDAFEDLMGQFSEKETDADEGNAYAHAVKKAKMNGKKKGDKIDGPDGDEITLEKDEKTPLGEFVLSYFDRETGQFPKGETAVLTMVEKDYGEEFITPAKKFIEMINNKVAEVMGYRDTEMEESGLQYYTGKKKYGKEGMTALAKAGREGASEQELGRIKDQYKKESEDIRRLAGL